MSPSGPPATTSILAAFAGRADRRPSKVERAKSLENMTSVFEERRRRLIEIERKECLMKYQWALRWTLYLETIGLSALQSRGDRPGQDESLQDNQVRREVFGNPVQRRCARLHAHQEVCKGVLRLWVPDNERRNSTVHAVLAGSASGGRISRHKSTLMGIHWSYYYCEIAPRAMRRCYMWQKREDKLRLDCSCSLGARRARGRRAHRKI